MVPQLELDVRGLRLLGVPGEPVGALSGRGLVGLADGYIGYVEQPAAIEAGEGEAARSYYGPGLASLLGL